MRFVSDRGFVEELREQESRLDLSRFDPSLWAREVARAEAEGITVRSFAELAAADPEGAPRKLHELHWQIAQDIPHMDQVTKVPFETWAARFESPRFLPEGNIVALAGDRYIGASVLWANQAGPENLDTGMTGVLREYRNRGIATAMKVQALTYAKASGATTVRTSNEVNNNGMLGINFRLGFEKTPAWIFFGKALQENA